MTFVFSFFLTSKFLAFIIYFLINTRITDSALLPSNPHPSYLYAFPLSQFFTVNIFPPVVHITSPLLLFHPASGIHLCCISQDMLREKERVDRKKEDVENRESELSL